MTAGHNRSMNLFVCGALVFPEAMAAVAGQVFPFREGVLRGYAEFSLKHPNEAALIPFPDTCTGGVVYSELSDEAVRRLDAFAGATFRRVEVNVEAADGQWVEAESYVLTMRYKKLLTATSWDRDEFRLKHLGKFLKHHGG